MSHHSAAASGHDEHAADHGTLKSYIVGFALSLILTFGSFGLVMSGALPRATVVIGVVALCVAQLLVQLVSSLHMGSKSSRDNLSTFVFTALIIFIIVGGSAWVLYNMNVNMGHSM